LSALEIFLRTAFAVLIYPGFGFLVAGGLVAQSFLRQFAARAEGRATPPLWQPFYDVRKLFRLPANVPAGTVAAPELDDDAKIAFEEVADTRREGTRLSLYAIPLLALLALSIAMALLPLPGNLYPFLNTNDRPLGADLLAVAGLLLVPAVGTALLGSLGGSVYAQLAGSRIFQLLVVCAFPYAIAVFAPALALGTFNTKLLAEANSPAMLGLKSLSALLFLLCLPALLRLRPVIASSAEALEGITTDLGGVPLGLVWLVEWAERIAFVAFFALLLVPFGEFMAVWAGGALFALGAVGLVDTLFSQVRTRDALTFYLRYANPAALIVFLLATLAVKL
jgi:formate hydrogenlyase subunit 4